MVATFEIYLEDGCGRCSNYKTPQCKVHTWKNELNTLRRIVLECGLDETIKWNQPCYTLKNKNVIMVTALKHHAVLSFFKGSLLKDEKGLLIAPGKSSQYDRQFRFTDLKDILEIEDLIKAYIFEAIDIEQSGKKVKVKKKFKPLPEELQAKFKENPQLKLAFQALTPGRQRGYAIHFSEPKRTETRFARIDKCTPLILKGEGLHDAYRAKLSAKQKPKK